MIRGFAVMLLTAVYLLMLDSVHPWDVAAGVCIAIVVVMLLGRFLFQAPGMSLARLAGRIARFPRFTWAVVLEIVAGTWQVALVVLRLRPLERPGIVAVPIGARTPTGVAVSALAITLSPGELLVDIDSERDVMLIHVLDASDPDGLRAKYDEFYERYQRQVFP